MPLSRSTAGEEPLRPVITTMLPLPPRSSAIFWATFSAIVTLLWPMNSVLSVGTSRSITTSGRLAFMTARAAGTRAADSTGLSNTALTPRASRSAHVVALLGDVDVAIEHDQLDVRMPAGFGLERLQHGDAPGVVEAGLREADRDVIGLAVDGDRAFRQWENIGEGQLLVEFGKLRASHLRDWKGVFRHRLRQRDQCQD